MYSQKQPCPPPSPLTSLLPGSRGPNHVLRVSLLLFIYLVPYFALFLQPFEWQPTWWCEKKDDSYMLWGSTNLGCSKLLPARILFGPRAPKVSSKDTGNCSKHSKINVSHLNFFFKHKMLELEDILEIILSILLITDGKLRPKEVSEIQTPSSFFKI